MYKLLLVAALLISSCAGEAKPKQRKEPGKRSNRITGKQVAEIENFPYQVSLEYIGFHRCGAAIISNEWVITATHCVNRTIQAEQLAIRAGTSTIRRGGSVHKVVELVRHPKYNYVTTNNDIAVLKVSPPFEFSNKVQPISLTTKEPKAGTRGVVTGWGSAASGGPTQVRLHSVSIPIVDREECNRDYAKYGGITSNMICAFEEGQDACKGDSGSPLVIEGKLAGIVSFGMGCNVAAFPGVYTNIASLRNFIAYHTGIK